VVRPFPLPLAAALRRDRRRTTCPLDQRGACGIGGVMIDRLSIRIRPPAWPVMYQTWGTLLFLHWPIAAERPRPLIPPRLSLDTFEGRARVSVTPFTMWGIRAAFLPSLPVLSASHELNVRTYVHLDGVPGVWFFSLDASNALAVWGARVALELPYFGACLRLQERPSAIQFASTRTHPGAPAARFEATRGPAAVRPGEAPPGGHRPPERL
jgi:uncharacterized protein YqjF (DUF2071 family)